MPFSQSLSPVVDVMSASGSKPCKYILPESDDIKQAFRTATLSGFARSTSTGSDFADAAPRRPYASTANKTGSDGSPVSSHSVAPPTSRPSTMYTGSSCPSVAPCTMATSSSATRPSTLLVVEWNTILSPAANAGSGRLYTAEFVVSDTDAKSFVVVPLTMLIGIATPVSLL